MTREDLLVKISFDSTHHLREALRAVVELHKPDQYGNCPCQEWAVKDEYPCYTIEAIEKELK